MITENCNLHSNPVIDISIDTCGKVYPVIDLSFSWDFYGDIRRNTNHSLRQLDVESADYLK